MTIFLSEDIQPAQPNFKIATALHIALTAVSNLTATDLQAAIREINAKVPTNATGLVSVPSGNLQASNVQAALNELQTEIDTIAPTGLNTSQERILNNITEGSTTAYNNVDSLFMTIDTSPETNPPTPSLPFQSTLTGLTRTSADIFIQVPTGTDLNNLSFVAYDSLNQTNIVGIPFAFTESDWTAVTGAPPGQQHYRYTTQSFTVTASSFYFVQRSSTVFSSYALSRLFSVPVSTLQGLIAESQLSLEVQGQLRGRLAERINRLQKFFLDQLSFLESTIAEPITNIRASNVFSISDAEYTPLTSSYVWPSSTVYLSVPADNFLSTVSSAAAPTETPLVNNDLGLITDGGRRVYEITPRPNWANVLAFLTLRSTSPDSSIITVGSAFKIGRNNLDSALSALILEAGTEGFGETIDVIGQPPNRSINSFHYLPLSSLPERLLTNWTSSRTASSPNIGLVPQVESTTITPYVILLPSGQYPNRITWNPATTQPAAGQNSPGAANLTYGDFNEVSGLDVPPNYQGFVFNMPPFNADSALRPGGTLRGGELGVDDIRDVQFSNDMQIRDENLNLQTTQTISQQDRDRLNALALRTYTADRTESSPNLHYEVCFASLWPDPEIDYENNRSNPLVNPNTGLPARAEITGIVDNPPQPPQLIDVSGVVGASFTVQPPAAAVFENIHDGVKYFDVGPGLYETSSRVEVDQLDASTNGKRIRLDNRGVISCCTVNLKRYGTEITANTFLPITSIGLRSSMPPADLMILGLKGNANNEQAEFVFRHIRQVNTASHIAATRRTTALRIAGTQLPTLVCGTGTGQLDNGSIGWEVPIAWIDLQGATFNIRFQLVEDGSAGELVEHQFTVSNLRSTQAMATTFNVTLGGIIYAFQAQFFLANDPGTVGTAWATVDALVISCPDLTDADRTIIIDIPTEHSINIIVPAGAQFDNPTGIFADHSGGRYDVAFFARNSREFTDTAEIEFRCSINGENTPFFRPESNPWTSPIGSVASSTDGGCRVEYGGFTQGTISRLMVLRPKAPNTVNDDDMSGLSFRTARNELYAGLLRKKGLPYRETFGTATNLISFKGPANSSEAFGASTSQFINLRYELEDGINREFNISGTNNTILTPLADFTAMVTVGVRIQVTVATVASASTDFRNFLQIVGEWIETPPGGSARVLPGLPMNGDIERNFVNGGRVETSAGGATDAVFDFEHSRTVRFRRNYAYMFRVNINKVNMSTSNTDWPASNFGSLNYDASRLSVFVSPQLGDTV